jgi:hypothetical protein
MQTNIYRLINDGSLIQNNMETECGTVIEYLEHNKALEQSPEFQKIEQEVDNEVYRLFALERIQQAEKYLAEHGDYEDTFDDEFDAPTEYDIYLSKRSNRIKEAKRLLEKYPNEPEHAARLFIQLGSCHWIWAEKKRILKEKYGITWYAPSEVNPDCIFD